MSVDQQVTEIGSSDMNLRTSPDGDEIDSNLKTNLDDGNNFSKWQQRKILLLVSLSTLVTSIGSAIYLPLLNDLKNQLNATNAQMILSLALYNYVFGLASLIWGPLSDSRGRKWIIFVGILEYALFTLLCGISSNIYELNVFRSLQAIGAAAAPTTGSGVVQETFSRETRGRAMGLYSITPILGVIIGPFIGGLFDSTSVKWRGAFYFLFSLSICISICVFFFLPETLILSKDQGIPKFRPWTIFKYLKDFKILLIVLYNGLAYSSYYTMQVNLAFVLDTVYHLQSIWVGVAFIPIGVGVMLGNYLGGYISDFFVKDTFSCDARLIVMPMELPFFTAVIIVTGYILGASRTHLAIPLVVAVLMGFFYSFGRPATVTFAIERARGKFDGVSASSVSGLIYFSMTIMAASSAQISALFQQNVGMDWYFIGLAGLVFTVGIILIMLSLHPLDKQHQSLVIETEY